MNTDIYIKETITGRFYYERQQLSQGPYGYRNPITYTFWKRLFNLC